MAVLALKQWFSLKFMQCASIISSESFWKIYLHPWINLEFPWSSLKVVRTSTREWFSLKMFFLMTAIRIVSILLNQLFTTESLWQTARMVFSQHLRQNTAVSCVKTTKCVFTELSVEVFSFCPDVQFMFENTQSYLEDLWRSIDVLAHVFSLY